MIDSAAWCLIARVIGAYTLTLTLTLTLIIVYFDNSTTKSNNQCSTFRINTNSFNVERHGDHIKTYIHVDIT